MTESLIIFTAAAILLFFLIRWLIKSESDDIDVEQKLKEYSSAKEFERFYAKHPYKKPGAVIKKFEKQYPKLANSLKKKRVDR